MAAMGDSAHWAFTSGRQTGCIMLTSHTARSFFGRSGRRAAAAVLVAASLTVIAAPGRSVGAATAQADLCHGAVVSSQVSAASLPGGAYSVTDACIPQDAFYETGLAGYRLQLGMGLADYDDGHSGRIAFAALTAPDGQAFSLVGVEDPALELVRWALAGGTHSQGSQGTSLVGEGPTDAPGTVEETARVELTVDGTGTDLMTASGEVPEMLRDIVLDAVEHLQG